MATVSKSPELYLSKKHPLPENVKYNAFYSRDLTKVHQDLVPWTGQRPHTPQENKTC